MTIRAASLAALAGCAVCGCASAQPAGGTGDYALPVAASPAVLASTTMSTSPDGGIYTNPDAVQVVLVARRSGTTVIDRAGAGAASWRQLQPLGDFTFVGLRLHNGGKAWSDLQLNATQIASDFAPDGTGTGALRRFYHPMFALAVLSAKSSDSHCTIHLDPGETASAVLVYPPLRATDHVVWGVYQGFALSVPFAGAVPPGESAWHETICSPPPMPPQ